MTASQPTSALAWSAAETWVSSSSVGSESAEPDVASVRCDDGPTAFPVPEGWVVSGIGHVCGSLRLVEWEPSVAAWVSHSLRSG